MIHINYYLLENLIVNLIINNYLLQHHNKPNVTFNFIPVVSEVYIDNVINKLKNKSSSGYDNISNKHIKYAKNVLIFHAVNSINKPMFTYWNIFFSIKAATG